MKKMMGLMIYGGLIFGLSAGGAWYMHTKHQEELAAERQRHQPSPEEMLVPSTTAHPTVTDPEIRDKMNDDALTQVPVRAESMTVEEMVRHGMKLKERDARIRAREESLERVEAQYSLMLEEIVSEQREINGLMLQAREHRKAADEILQHAEMKHQEASTLFQQARARQEETQSMLDKATTQQREKLASQQAADPEKNGMKETTSPEDRNRNLKQIAELLAGMNAEAAAKALTGYINNGDMDTAVQLVSLMEGRKSSAILEAMALDENDEKLVDQLLEQFAKMRRPERKL